MTVIIITHNTALAPMADKVIHFKNGKGSTFSTAVKFCTKLQNWNIKPMSSLLYFISKKYIM